MTTFPRSRFSWQYVKALLALMLCYGLFVQALAAHHATWMSTDRDINAICLNDPDALQHDQSPDDRGPDHTRATPCCLIFGSGDVPRLDTDVSQALYRVTLALYPTIEFFHPAKTETDDPAARPRAPPRMG